MLPGPPLRLGVLATVLVLASACDAAAPTPLPDPGAPCAGADEQRLPAFYPELEALLPAEFEGSAAATRDSGRYCSAKTLGSLLAAGITELHFAGATWPADGESGIALVVYRAPDLTVDVVADSFALGAGAARGVTQVHAEEVDVAGRRGVRITAVSDRRPQIVFMWPGAAPATVNVVIGSGVADDRLREAIATFGDG